MRSAERPWDGEGVAGNGVMVWVEGGRAGRGGDGEEEGEMSGGDGMEMLGSQCTAERAGRSTVALVTIIEIIREIILEVINLFYIIFTIPWVGAIIIIPVLEIETPRHRKMKQLAGFSPGLKAQASRGTAHPHLPYHTATQTEGALGPGAWSLSNCPGAAPQAQHSLDLKAGPPGFQGCAVMSCRTALPSPCPGFAHRALERPAIIVRRSVACAWPGHQWPGLTMK